MTPMRAMAASAAIMLCLPAAMCSSTGQRVQIRTVEVPVEVERPCPGQRPERPAPIDRPLPTDLEQLAALLGAKLAEYTGPGKYVDQAEAIFTRCPLEGDQGAEIDQNGP